MNNKDVLQLKSNLFGVADEIRTEWKDLHNRLSVADQKIVDIEHFAEFYKLNASQGYKVYKMLQETLLERRNIKDRIEELKPLFDYLNDDLKIYDHRNRNTANQRVNNKIKLKENRKYKARILTELFDGEMII